MKTFFEFWFEVKFKIWVMILAIRWFDTSLWDIRSQKRQSRNKRREKYAQHFDTLAIFFLQIFIMNKDICIWVTIASYCEIFEIEDHWSDNWLKLRVRDLISRRCKRNDKRYAHNVIFACFESFLYVRSERDQRFDERSDLWSKRAIDC